MTGDDPLLAALAQARDLGRQADTDIRLMLAYARELATPRPYRLADLAEAAGISISGVRIAYTQADIAHATRLTSGTRAQHLEAVITCLLADSGETYPAV
jgi:hypothetical protein